MVDVTAYVVTHNNGRVWSIHSTRERRDAERERARRDELGFYADGAEECEIDQPGQERE